MCVLTSVVDATDADGGGERVVEVAKLTPADRKLLVKGVLASEDQDQEQFLTELRERLDRSILG